MTRRISTMLLVLAMLASACSSGVRELIVGEDSCHYCRMTIDDPRFGAQLLTAKGRTETFDSIECIASYVAALAPNDSPHGIWVADYEHPKQWIEVTHAQFLQKSRVRSPMGRALVAFDGARGADALIAQYSGRALAWEEVLSLVESEKVVASPVALSAPPVETATAHPDTVFVTPPGGANAPFTSNNETSSIATAVARVARGGVVRLRAGVYAESTIVVRQPLTLVGDSGAVLDGQGEREILDVGADSVTVRGITFRNTGTSQVTDRAALRVVEAIHCLIEYNRFENTLFGIYLQRASGCRVRHNTLQGMEGSQTVTGNGLHLWSSRDVILEDNIIRGHRDGIYFEFVTNGIVRRNVSEGSHRYGLHFMFSDSCHYEDNVFRSNESGVAVMYSKRVHIVNNAFEHNRGSAAYGLLLKEITDSEIRGNLFSENSIALHLEGSSRNAVMDNDFVRNGWGVRVLADAQDNVLRGNLFSGNVFDVGTNSRTNYSTFNGNWWDRYRGYDLDHDGHGDVAHAPVRLFALLVEQSPSALILTRSILVDLLDVAERVLPVLTPATLRDQSPLMHAPRRVP